MTEKLFKNHENNKQDNMTVKIKEIPIDDYEKVIEVIDEKSQLHCFIAIHDTTLGPALGGTRIYPYLTPKEALNDVLRLAKAMTKKSAIAEVGFGGGKSVIIADPIKGKTKALLQAFGKVVDSLKGQYIAAEDIGSTLHDMSVIKAVTPYVSALPTKSSSGDPSRFTAWGVIKGIEATAQKLWKSHSLAGKTVAVQGLGHVGSKIVEHLFWAGAHLIITDTDKAKLTKFQHLYGASIIEPQQFLTTPCDILCPCAMGGIINEKTIATLQCKAIAGAANNQLLENEDGERLFEKNILYAPDYIINSGGIINVSLEFLPGGYNPVVARDKVNNLFKTLLFVYQQSEELNQSTNKVAEDLATYNLKNKISARKEPISFF